MVITEHLGLQLSSLVFEHNESLTVLSLLTMWYKYFKINTQTERHFTLTYINKVKKHSHRISVVEVFSSLSFSFRVVCFLCNSLKQSDVSYSIRFYPILCDSMGFYGILCNIFHSTNNSKEALSSTHAPQVGGYTDIRENALHFFLGQFSIL